MSKTGKFLSKNEETDIQQEQEFADIHPFSQVKPREKKKHILIALVISTVLIYITVGYLFFKELAEKDSSKQAQKETVEAKKTSSSSKPSSPSFDFELTDLENNVYNSIKDIPLPQLKFSEGSGKEVSRYRYYLLKAREAEIKGNYMDAISFYKKAWDTSKRNPEILYRIALLHYKLGNLKGTEIYAKKLLEIDKKHIKSLILLAKAYEKMGNLKKAKLILEEAYFLYPENKDVLENLGRLYEKENALIVAKDVYKTLADMGYLEGKLGLARIYEKLNDKESALKIYREIYEDPNIPEKVRSYVENKIISLE